MTVKKFSLSLPQLHILRNLSLLGIFVQSRSDLKISHLPVGDRLLYKLH